MISKSLSKFPVYKIILLLIIVLGALVRFYNLDWGDGFFFHPDERNIGMAISRINFAEKAYNPEFFAYGSFPIYMIYLLSKGNFETSLLLGRALSALFSTISLYLIYLITKQLLITIFTNKNQTLKSINKVEKYALLTTIISAFSPGLIQFAHFTTFESFLTFEYLLFTYFGIKLIYKPSKINYFILGVITGISIGTKIVSLFLLGILFVIHLMIVLSNRSTTQNKLSNVIRLLKSFFSIGFVSSVLISIIMFIVTNPFMFLDFQTFQGSLNYESSVARGTLLVFYTQQFIETIPFIYQFLYVFPSLISWPFTILGVISLVSLSVYVIYFIIKLLFGRSNTVRLPLLVFTSVALGYSVFHLLMFVKWSRYMIPATPFLIISVILLFAKLNFSRKKGIRIFTKIVLYTSAFFAIIQGINFFTIYLKPDPRIEAADWLAKHSSEKDTFAGEVYDLGMTAFNSRLQMNSITEFDYYNLDDGYDKANKIKNMRTLLNKSDYIIVPAERVYPTRARLSQRYPEGYEHYSKLFSEETDFKKVAEFSRTTYLEDLLGLRFYNGGVFAPLNYDETFRVFDQPTISIFKKER